MSRLGLPLNGTSAGNAGILATCSYGPASLGILGGASTTMADLDVLNLVVTFTAPASGKVVVDLTAYCEVNTAGAALAWGLRESTTTVTGSTTRVVASSAAGSPEVRTAKVLITGLTPGNSYTWKWAYFRQAGSGNATTYVQTDLPALMVVTAAP